jgi:hypothetical protein
VALTIGKKDVAVVAETLDEDYPRLAKKKKAGKVEVPAEGETPEQFEERVAQREELEAIAADVLKVAFEIYESKANFTVVGQVRYRKGEVDPEDPSAGKIALGWFGTEGQATKAAESLVYSTATGEEFRAWVLNVWHGSPATFHTERKLALKREDAGLEPADKFIHENTWRLQNPGVDRKHYPGPPKPDPRSDCPICGQPQPEEDTCSTTTS